MIDILAFGVHPDDIELGSGGTLIKHVKLGFKVGLIDLTQGEMGTRGDVQTRHLESQKAADIIGAEFRLNLKMEDAFISVNKKNVLEVVKMVRDFKPKLVLCNAIKDRHPDHSIASELVSKACFTSGLLKVKTSYKDNDQLPHRPKAVFHYIQDQWVDPDIVVDISDEFEDKTNAVLAYQSQFYNPNSKEPTTPISSEEFLDSLTAKAQLLGRSIKTKYGEGFTMETPTGINNLFDII
jgi:bacillithiol biosynthesis deacetylase BshB1